LKVAEMLAVVLEPTVRDAIVNVAEVAPAGTDTDVGTVAAEVLLDIKATETPPVGAADPSVTVPVEVVPPTTVVGFRVTELTDGALTVRLAEAVVVPVVAVIANVAFVETAEVEAVNVAVLEPARTVTDVGTVAAAVLLELRLTITDPPEPTALFRVTVPVEVVPPYTVAGASVTVVTTGTVIVRLTELGPVPTDAVIVTGVFEATNSVLIGNVATVAPAATVTVAGTVAADVFEEVRVTTWPPVGAAFARVAVPVPVAPPKKLVAEVVSVTEFAACRVKVAVWVTPVRIAVIVDVDAVGLAVVVIANVPVVAPAAIVAVAGIVVSVPVAERAIASPPVGATLLIATVPIEPAPLTSVAGLSESPVRVGAVTVRAA
jgi:hypothetical protein